MPTSGDGRRVLVTGSGRGIGKAIAKRFAEEGARVQLTARTSEELNTTRKELATLAGDVRAAALDLTQPDAATELVNQVHQAWGGLDILVTNAGAAPQGSFLELADSDWPLGFSLKMFGNLRVIKASWPLLRESGGHLVMIGGGTARMPDRRLSLVSAVNGGIHALAKSIAEQGIIDGIHVNLVQPGTVKTSRRQKLFEKFAVADGVSVEEYVQRAVSELKVTRLGEPGDIADVVAFLASGGSRWIQGATLDVDGGQNKGI